MDARTTAVKRSRGRPHGSKSREVFPRHGARRDLVPIDENSGPGRFFSKMIRDITADLGGRQVTRIERELIEAFAGSAIALRLLTHQVLLGEISEIDLNGYATMASTMLRIGARLGLSRRQQMVPGLHDRGGLLDQIAQERAADIIDDADNVSINGNGDDAA